MTTPSHYRDAEDTLRKTLKGARLSTTELGTAQLQAMLAVADELRNVHHQLTAMRNQISQLQDALLGR